MLEINNNDFGGFVVSNNILDGKAIRYSYREKSAIPQLNGWTLLSIEDDEAYLANSKNISEKSKSIKAEKSFYKNSRISNLIRIILELKHLLPIEVISLNRR